MEGTVLLTIGYGSGQTKPCWAQDLSQQARARFRCRCRYRDRRYLVPRRTVMREVLTRVDPASLSGTLQRWNRQHAEDERWPSTARRCAMPSMTTAVRPTSWASSTTKARPATPKKVAALPVEGRDEVKQTNEIGMVIPVFEALDMSGKTITANALPIQRTLADYLLEHDAHSIFTVKDH